MSFAGHVNVMKFANSSQSYLIYTKLISDTRAFCFSARIQGANVQYFKVKGNCDRQGFDGGWDKISR